MSAATDRLLVGPPPHPIRPTARRRWPPGVGSVLAAILLTTGAAVLCLPDLFRLDRRSPMVQLVSARPLIAAGVFAAAVFAALVTLVWRPAWPIAAGLTVVTLIATAMILPRVLADPVPPLSGRPLTILAFNTFKGNADLDEVRELIVAERPDLVALSEAGEGVRSRLAPLVEPLGYRLFTSTGKGRADVGGVTALVADHLGDVDVRYGTEMTAFPYAEISGGELGSLRFAVFHSVAPVPGAVPGWAADLSRLSQWCAGPTPAVIAGDFNATLDHSVLRSEMAGCSDAAEQVGKGLLPTWGPTPRLRAVGPQIDHVLMTEGIYAEAFTVHEIAGSDHRAIVTRLRVPE